MSERRGILAPHVLYVLFFASGIAGLVYEVCWVRQFGNAFGNTVQSASLVAAVFMCGLGLGSWRAGIWADRRLARPGATRALYGAFGGAELAVALLGVVLAVLLPQLGGLSASVSSYTRGSDGWYVLSFGAEAVRFVTAIVLVAPPSALMGATLTLLVRATLARDVTQAGFRIGLLYGVNTAGAALGAFACDALLVPQLGIVRTQLVAVGLDAVVAAGAFVLARAHDGAAPVPVLEPAPEPSATPAPGAARSLQRGAWLALALSGFAALGMEIVWFRFLGATLGAYRYVFSLVLTMILVGICAGAALGGWLQRRYGHALELFVGAQALFATSALVALAAFSPFRGTPYVRAFESIAAVVLVPSVLMGLSFPLVNAHVQDAIGAVGRRTGAMYLANTLGSVAGSLAAGFLFARLLGSQSSFAVFAACAALAPVALVLASPRTPRLRAVSLASAGATVAAIAIWMLLPADFVPRRFVPSLPPPERIVAQREGSDGMVHVLDNGPAGLQLFTNGHPMSGTSLAAQRYMRAFSHLPLLMTEHPQRALVICFGVGSTLHATSLHPSLTRIEVADLSRNVLEHARFFRANNHDVLQDPRVSVFLQDGRQHLRQQAAGSYDLITLEPPPIEFAGVSSLYSREFYELAKSRLAPGGLMTQWLPAYAVPPETGLAMVRAFLEAFPGAVLLSGSGPELILMGAQRGEVVLDLDRVEAALRANPAVAADLKRVALGSLTDLVATFVAGADHLTRATAGVAAVTDDRPQMEYTFGRASELPRGLFGDTADVRRFCPRCFEGDRLDPRVAGLTDQLAVLERVYATESFRRNRPPFSIAADGLDAVIARSDYLRALVTTKHEAPLDARALFARGYMLAQRGDLAGAERDLVAGLAAEPSDIDARYNLAVLYASTNREAAAIAAAEKVLAIQPSHAKARAMLCALRPDACAAPPP
ncbi:MAG TPA: fused MFS/spermidine synthase [Labilithrix sp.]|nr:fused MFS/spermidine synthase [Labilithrix sp.]